MTARPDSVALDPDASLEKLLALLDRDEATNRLLARHPRASHELLEKLSHSSDKATRRAVASHPNTPPPTLVRLGQQFPKEFLANPALDLLLMVNPDLIEQAPHAFLIRLLKQVDCPTSLLVWAAGHSQAKVQLAVAMNAKAPEQALEKLQSSKHPSVLESIQSKTGSESVDDPEKAFEEAVRARLAALTPTQAQLAWEMGDIGLPQWPYLPLLFRWEKSELIDPYFPEEGWLDNPNLPKSVLNILSESKNPEILKCVRNHKNTAVPARPANTPSPSSDTEQSGRTAKTLLDWQEALSGDLAERIRVAGLSEVQGAVLDRLSKDTSKKVRIAVGSNLKTQVSTLDRLSTDKAVDVRIVVAANENTSLTIIESMIKDNQDERVLAALEARKGLSAYSINSLRQLARRGRWYRNDLRHAKPDVRIAAQRDDVLHACTKDPAKAVISSRPIASVMALCSGSHIEPSKLARLANSSDWLARAAVARNASTPNSLLKKLNKDPVELVRILSERAGERNQTEAPIQGKPRIQLDSIAQSVALEFDADLNNQVLGDPIWRHFVSVYKLWCVLPIPSLAEIRQILGEPIWLQLWKEGAKVKHEWHHKPHFCGRSLRGFIAGHRDCPSTVLDYLSQSDDPDALLALIKNPSVTDAQRHAAKENLDKCRGSAKTKDYAIASNHDATPEILESITLDADRDVLIAIARNPNTSARILRALASRSDAAQSVAANPMVPNDVIDLLIAKWPAKFILEGFVSNSDSLRLVSALEKLAPKIKHLREAVANGPCAQSLAFVLNALATSGGPGLRQAIAGNPCTPVEILANLASHDDVSTREAVASNPHTPAPTLGSMVADKAESVRWRLAGNPRTPRPSLVKLESDISLMVRCTTAMNPNRPLLLVADFAEIARDYLARLQQMEEGVGKVFPSVTLQDLRRALTWLKRIPEPADNRTLTRLVADQDWLTRLGVALHPQRSVGQLKVLSKDKNRHVAAVAAQQFIAMA